MKILDRDIDLITHGKELYQKHWPYLLAVLLTQFADAISTTLFMSVDGVATERNVLVRQLSLATGIVVGPIVGKSAQLLAMIALCCFAPRLTRLLCWVVIVINFIAVVHNVTYYWSCLPN